MRYHVGVDVHDFDLHTHGRKEIVSYDEDWVSAAEYVIKMVKIQQPLANVELAYVKEYSAHQRILHSIRLLRDGPEPDEDDYDERKEHFHKYVVCDWEN